jgi:hypothetical protein
MHSTGRAGLLPPVHSCPRPLLPRHRLCPSAPLAVAPMWGCRRMLSARLLHFRCLAPLPAQPLAGHTIHRNSSLTAPIALLQPQASKPPSPLPTAHYPLPATHHLHVNTRGSDRPRP